MRDLFRSLRARLVLLLLLVLVPAAVMVAVTHSQQRQFATAEMEKSVRRITGLVLDKEDAVIGGAQALVIAIANSMYVQRRDKEGCRRWVEAQARAQSVYFNLGYVDEHGNLACSAVPAPETLNFADRQWFRDARDTGAFTTGEYVRSRITGEPVITYAYPITGADGAFRGVAYAVTTLAWLAHMVTTAELPPNSTATVVDVQGDVLARFPDPDGLTGKRMPRTAAIALLEERPGPRVLKAKGHDGLERIYSLAPLKVANRDVYLLIGLPLEAIYGSIDRTLRTNLIWLTLLGGLAIATLWIGVERLLAGRIRRLADASAGLAAGDLSVRSAGQDGVQELDQLARAFDQMAESLEQHEAERELAGQALRESEARYRQLIELSPDAVFLQSEGNFLYLNIVALRLFGAEQQEQLLGRPVVEYIHPKDRAAVQDRIRTLNDRMEPVPLREMRILRLDGKEVDVEVAAAPFRFDGKILAQVVARNITERKHAQAVLRESEERFRALVETSPDAISIQAEGKIEFVNNAFVKLLGAESRTDLAGRQVHDFFHPDSDDLISQRSREVYQNSKAVPPAVLTLLRLDRTPVEVEGIATPITIGGRTALMSVMRDITDRRNAERAVLESRAQLRGIIDSALDAIITINEDQCVVLFNPAAEAMFQCSSQEVVGTSIERFIPLRSRAGHTQGVHKFSVSGMRNLRLGGRGNARAMRADGSEFPFEASISQVTVLGQRYFTVIMRDFTERQRAMDELEYANTRLIQLSRQILEVQEAERREIARELHDEIGQTLTAIKINVQGAQRLVRDEAGKKRLEEVADLAGQTLDKVRGMSLNLRPSQLDDLGLEAAVRWNATRQAAAKGLKLHFESALGQGRLPGAVETACFRVSQEALTNVVRHAAAGNVWVTLAVEAGKVELTVRDDGCGFDPVAKRQQANGGASFGLLGMEERAKLTGGVLQIEATAGGGTTVRAWFPIGGAAGGKQ